MSTPSQEFRDGLVQALPPLRRFALVLTRAEADADDLLQATCERALARWTQFQPGTRQQSWLFSIMHSIWKNMLRKQATRTRVHAELPPEEGITDGIRIVDGKIAFAEVLSHLNEIDPDQAMAVTLVSLDGLSYREAAQVLDIPQGTLESRIARGRIALGRRLQDVSARPGEGRATHDNGTRSDVPLAVAARDMVR